MIHSKMVRIDRDIFIPNSYVKTIGLESKSHMILILSPNANFARFIPCSEEVTKVRLIMPSVAPKFISKMETIFFQKGIKPLHTSASSSTIDPLVYESYIDSKELDSVSLDTLIDQLQQLPGVTDVFIETLKTTKIN